MHKISFSLLVLFASVMLHAQPANDELLRDAKKALKSYRADPSANRDKLPSARRLLEEFAKKSDQTRNPEVQLLYGEVCLAIVMSDGILNPNADFGGTDLACFAAYYNAYRYSSRASDKKEAITGLEALQTYLSNSGVSFLNKSDFQRAFPVMEAMLQLQELLKENNSKYLMSSNDYAQYVNAFSYVALQIKNYGAAEKYLNLLIKMGAATGDTYDRLVKVKEARRDKSGAEAILKEGRNRFPDDGPLLFSDINWRMANNQLTDMPPLLKKAIELEPDNYALLHTLGSVNERLWQAALSSGNAAQANSLFGEAVKYYELATKKDPKNPDYLYSTGALYFNKAAMLSKQFSEESTEQKMKQQKEEMLGLFRKALPFFQKAESLSPDDINTLIALKTIYSYLEDPLMSEFSRRLKTVEGGGSNKVSYFKN